MIKKFMFTSILIFNILNAATLETKDIYIGQEDVVINFSDMIAQNKDWIAIYPKGSNTDWKNVIKWAWTEDATEGELTFKGLENGQYEARAFYNNSYKIEIEKEFFVIGNTINRNLNAYYKNGLLEVTTSPTVLQAPEILNPKDWIGVYKKGTSNDWANVLKWAWVKDFQNDDYTVRDYQFHNVNLADGDYEVRYFLNNSFKTYMSASFTVGNIGNDNLNIKRLNPFFDNGTLKVKLIINELAPINHKPKDWVGLYKKGKSNDWGNVIKWTWANAYVPNNDDEDGPTLSFGQVNLADGEYEVRYFLKNSFTTYMSADFKVQ